MSAIQRVLFPIDLSSDCESLLPTVRKMIETWGAEVTLLHIVESRRWLRSKPEFGRLMAQMQEIAEGGLEARHAVCRLESGAPADRILQFVRANRIDLVVMTAGGPGSLARNPLGSVADQVLAEAPCPVWLDWGSGRSRPESGMFARHICCALELDDSDEAVFGMATQFTAELEAALMVVHAVLPPAGQQLRPWDRAVHNRALAKARNRIDTLRQRFFPAAEITVEVGLGHAVVSRSIQLQNAGLLITPNRREAILAAEAECPVLRLATLTSCAAQPIEVPLRYAAARSA